MGVNLQSSCSILTHHPHESCFEIEHSGHQNHTAAKIKVGPKALNSKGFRIRSVMISRKIACNPSVRDRFMEPFKGGKNAGLLPEILATDVQLSNVDALRLNIF